MKRQIYFDDIEARLSWLATRIEVRSGINILNLNLHSEDFFIQLLNKIYGLNLENLNNGEQNIAGLDLVDYGNRIVMQVSSTATKAKIESSLAKDLSKYSGYNFRFVSISKKVPNLATLKVKNSSNLTYDPQKDTIDLPRILTDLKGLPIQLLAEIHKLVCSELRFEVDRQKVESNLATIIDILSRVDWKSSRASPAQVIPYDIEKKIDFNGLSKTRVLIDDYKAYYYKIDQIYTAFDEQGSNKSLSVLNGLRTLYIEQDEKLNADIVFNTIILKAMSCITESKNYTELPEDELRMAVEIITVDAFIRCKIFMNPEGYLNAVTG